LGNAVPFSHSNSTRIPNTVRRATKASDLHLKTCSVIWRAFSVLPRFEPRIHLALYQWYVRLPMLASMMQLWATLVPCNGLSLCICYQLVVSTVLFVLMHAPLLFSHCVSLLPFPSACCASGVLLEHPVSVFIRSFDFVFTCRSVINDSGLLQATICGFRYL
jgi:hypothetical protein